MQFGNAAHTSPRRLKLSTVIVGVVVGFTLLGLATGCSSNKANPVASASTTTSTTKSTVTTSSPAATSAAGKPCVAVNGPLPAGAPAVDVVVGPAPTELVIKDIKVGTGADVTPGSSVTVNYIGVACSTGKVFDSSYSRGQTATFPLTRVIPGWTNGIPNMKVGGIRLLGIPSAQAYGAQSPTPLIAPDEALWFVVEVTAVAP